MFSRLAFLTTCLLLLAGSPLTSHAKEEAAGLTNGALDQWTEGRPDGWEVMVGATQQGRGNVSRLLPIEGGGVRLEGDAKTVRWMYLRQALPTRVGTTWRLAFDGRVVGARLDPGQFGSCYAGLAFRNAAGQVLARTVRDIHQSAWAADTLHVTAPAETTTVEVALFLSKTGALELRKLTLTPMTAKDSFQVLAESMSREYSFFARHEVPWKQLLATHGSTLKAAKTSEAFRAALRPLLEPLADPHVSIADAQGRWMNTAPTPKPTANAPQIARLLPGLAQIGQIALVGKTPEGDGYLLLGSLAGAQLHFDLIAMRLRELRDTCPGLIIDLRLNGGGDERIAQRLVSMLTDERRPYGRAKVRSGPAFDDFAPSGTRFIGPGEAGPHRKPIAVLLGPICMSSGEAMAMMLDTLPHARSFGAPTRGASGSPRALTLPNGVRVRYSTWISLLPDGTVFERSGLQPDEAIAWGGPQGEDAVLRRARTWLGAQRATAGR